MNKKLIPLMLIMGFIFVTFIIPESVSLGISVNNEINYVANQTTTLQLCFRNSKNEADPIRITLEGELKDYITLNFPEVITLAPMATECYDYTIKMPSEMKIAGIVSSTIMAKEIPKEDAGGGIQFNIIVGVVHKISMRVPYPGKYIDWEFILSNIKENEPEVFRVKAISRGDEIIQRLSGTAQIYDASLNTLVDTVTFSEEVNINTNEERYLRAVWDAKGIKSGKYKVKATINYDDKQEIFEREFLIGSMEIVISNHTTEIYNDTINKFDVTLKSNWNDPIKDVYAEVKVSGNGYDSSFRMPSQEVGAFGTNTLTSYFEARGYPAGDYNLLITAHYSGKATTKQSVLHILERPIEAPSPINTTTLLIIIIIVMVLANVAWMVYGKIKKSKQPNQDDNKTMQQGQFQNQNNQNMQGRR